jgi:hypothetical protein
VLYGIAIVSAPGRVKNAMTFQATSSVMSANHQWGNPVG